MNRNNDTDGFDGRLFIRKIWRKKFIVLIVLLITLVPILIYNELADSKYSASSTLILEQINDLPSITQSKTMEYMLREVYLSNRIQEIKSRSLVKTLVKKLPQNIIDRLAVELDTTDIHFDQVNSLVTLIHGTPSKKGRIKVERVRKSDIINISFWSKDPEATYFVTNMLANLYVEQHMQIRREGASGIRIFLEEQLGIYREKLMRAEISLKNYKENNKITVLDKQAEEILNRYTEAEVLYNSTKAESGAKERRLAYIDQKISEEKQELVPSLTNISSPWAIQLKGKLVELELQHTELQLQNYSADHPRMLKIRERINQTKASLTSEAMKLAQGKGILDVFSHIKSYMEESLKLQVDLQSIEKKELVIKNILETYDNSLQNFPRKEIRLAQLNREKNVSEQTFLLLTHKREEARLSEIENKPIIRIIDEAEKPTMPIWPRKRLNILLGIMLGGLLGVALIFLSEYYQETIETTDDIEVSTDWSVIATIPKFRNSWKKLIKDDINRIDLVENTNLELNLNQTKKMNSASSISFEGEAYRMMTRNLQLLVQKEQTGVILVTSSSPQEGKSTTAINLAITLANMGQNTLLVDMDFRKPVIHKVFDIAMKPGAIDLLLHIQSLNGNLARKRQDIKQLPHNKTTIKAVSLTKLSSLEDIFDTIQSPNVENLQIMPSGNFEKIKHTHFSSSVIGFAFKLIKRFFDSVIIDSPPLLMVSEARIMASQSDGVIYVLESGGTTKKAATQAHKILKIARANILGSVLNKMSPTKIYGKKEHYYY